MLSGIWKTKVYLNSLTKQKKSQLLFYKENNASSNVLSLVDKESKSFGTIIEHMIREYYNIEKIAESQCDGIKHGKKVEIKSARYWNYTYDCKWQHLEKDYDYDYVILVLLDFKEIKTWLISKEELFSKELIHKKIVRKQGNQGYIISKKAISPYLIEINKNNVNDLLK